MQYSDSERTGRITKRVSISSRSPTTTDMYEYSAFGEVIAKTGNTVNPFGFKGALGYYATDTKQSSTSGVGGQANPHPLSR